MMFLKIALKNIRTYKKRSVITVVLSMTTTALLVFGSSFMDGSHSKMIENAVEIYPNYIQITHNKFRENPSYDNLIFATGPLEEILAREDSVAAFGERFETFVLLATDKHSLGVMLAGIEPEKEKSLSRLAQSLFAGDYLDKDDGPVIYIGRELAKRLEVGVGDKLSFMGTGVDYSIAADIVTVKGIFQTGLFDFDLNSSFMNKKYLDEIMASSSVATHLVVMPKEKSQAQQVAAHINSLINTKEYKAESWQEFMEGLVQAMEVDSIFGYITIGIFFIVIFFVIMIYTLLNIHARVREIGILRAVGTGQGQVFSMLIMESCALSLFGVLIGGIIGALFSYYFSINPIMLSGYEEQFKQYGLAVSSMPTKFSTFTILRDTVVMFILCVLSTLYPIVRLNRYRPVEAIHHV